MASDKKIGIKLSEKDRKFREFALSGNMWQVILTVCMPLAIYQIVNHIFTILDTMMASHISAQAVSAVAYLSQIQSMISALGMGLAAGSSLKISEAYGAGKYEMVKKRLSSLIMICFCIGVAVVLCMPFVPFFLRITGTPEDFITIGAWYFVISLAATVVGFFNNVYIAIERARGNSKRIMYLNMGIILLKLSMTGVFIYILNAGVTMISVATLISQCVLLAIAFKNLSGRDNVFGFSINAVTIKKNVVMPMLNISFPVMVEKVAFAMGKTVVNAMSKEYGQLTVGALGISNNISGAVTTVHNGFQDGTAAVISQNMGAGKIDRSIDAFKKALVINCLWGFTGWVLLMLFREQISFVFAYSKEGLNEEFRQTILKVFMYDAFGGCVPLGINAAVMSLLFGFGYTKISMIINFSRVFIFRIPVLWALQNFSTLGSESVGIVMMVSNILVAVMSSTICVFVLRHIIKNKDKFGGVKDVQAAF